MTTNQKYQVEKYSRTEEEVTAAIKKCGRVHSWKVKNEYHANLEFVCRDCGTLGRATVRRKKIVEVHENK